MAAMLTTSRFKIALVCLGVFLQVSAPGARAQDAESNALQIYGLTLDDTRLGDGFCEQGMSETVRPQCAQSRQVLPKVADIEVRTLPAPFVALTLAAEPGKTAEVIELWYAPREMGGQSFLITTTTLSPFNLDLARNGVVASFGAPTVEFTHADMEARGIHVNDLTVDTLIYVDRALPDTQWAAVAHRLRTEFDPTGGDLFSLTDTRLRTLGKWLGPDFRGAIVQIGESGWSHQSYITTILLDLNRAQSIFRLDG
jgi:hypothetical protein